VAQSKRSAGLEISITALFVVREIAPADAGAFDGNLQLAEARRFEGSFHLSVVSGIPTDCSAGREVVFQRGRIFVHDDMCRAEGRLTKSSFLGPYNTDAWTLEILVTNSRTGIGPSEPIPISSATKAPGAISVTNVKQGFKNWIEETTTKKKLTAPMPPRWVGGSLYKAWSSNRCPDRYQDFISAVNPKQWHDACYGWTKCA